MCGIAGIYSHKPVAIELYDSIIHLQHRGQDAAGIMTYDDRMHKQKGMGLAKEVFNESNMEFLTGNIGISHNRYPTHGRFSHGEVQPFWTSVPYGIALAHNGNLTNYQSLAEEITKKDSRYLNTTSDLEVLLHYFADLLHTNGTDLQAILEAINSGELDAEVSVVLSNRKSAHILKRAENHHVPAFFISHQGKTRKEFDAEMTAVMKKYKVKLVLLIGFMRILSTEFCLAWQDKLLNVHEEVLKNGDTETGCTIHFITEEVDGGPILIQKNALFMAMIIWIRLKSKFKLWKVAHLLKLLS